jgi:hypothetical protein
MAENESLAARGERAEQIKRRPELYKVCEGCESIVVVDAATCPNCHGYRFDFETTRVLASGYSGEAAANLRSAERVDVGLVRRFGRALNVE